MGNHTDNKVVWGHNAPSRNLAFPSTGANMTALEIITFLPNSLRSADVVFRFVTNGGKQMIFAKMANHARFFNSNPGHANTIWKQIQAIMTMHEYEGWNTTNHRRFFPNAQAIDFIGVDGFRVEAHEFPDTHTSKEGVLMGFPFQDLAKDIRMWPEGYDALDFTHAVLYARDHYPAEQYFYPEDYHTVVAKSGGPRQVTIAHCDQAAFNRWRVLPAYYDTKHNAKPKKVETGALDQAVEDNDAPSEPSDDEEEAEKMDMGD